MMEHEWIRLRDRWKKRLSVAKNMISVGLTLVGVGVWLLPTWWMRLVSFGIWLIIIGLLAYHALLDESPPTLEDEKEEIDSLKDGH